MASIVDEYGVQVTVDGELVMTSEQESRTRDLFIHRLRTQNVSFKSIGKIMGLSAKGAQNRYYLIPDEVKAYYGPLQLG